MANGICDACERRSAAHTVTTLRNGQRQVMELCGQDYARLRGSRGPASPFDSLFGGSSLFDVFDNLPSEFGSFASSLGTPLPRDREATNLEDYLSEHAKEIIQQAAETTVKFGRREVDTEHLLYALADSDVTAEILKQFKLKQDDLKGYIEANTPKGAGQEPQEGQVEVTVSPRVKAVLEAAFQTARELGHGYIGPEHLLIALADENEGLAGEILSKYGLTPQALRQKTVKVVGKGAKEGRVETKSHTPQLDKFSRDLSKAAAGGKLDPVIGRAQEIETTIEILARRTKNNPVLIGEPGVGKTAIVEGLAQRIHSGKVPEVLKGKRVVELNLNAMVAGSKYRGEFEERIKAVLDEIVEHNDELIVFVDELHTIVGAGQGGGEGGLDVSNVLKPALARGELHLIGATTLNEYQKYIEKDAALERRFQPVMVPEPTVEQTIEILRGLRDKYEAHHKIKITDAAIIAAAELSDRYISNRFLPDKAIDLIDQAASRVRIGADTFTQDIEEKESEINRLNREQEYAASHKNYEDARKLEKQLKDKNDEKDKLTEEWRRKKGVTSREVLPEHVAEIISHLTGIPVSELTEEEKNKLLKMEERLHKRVIGQDEAVRAVADAVRMARAGLSASNRPIATFLFLGPTGVGKTELARALAYLVFGDEEAMIRLDMSEYMERHSVARLIGSPPGYVGYEEGGQLTERVRRRPYSVVLLDEVEKAHPDVHNILLQVFDDGRLTDGKGRAVDFTNTIIIATSNIGASLIHENFGLKESDRKTYEQLKEALMEQLKQYFRPEFLNRIDEIIVFEALDKEQIREIVELRLEEVKRTARGQGITLEFTESAVNHLANIGYRPEFGARELRRRIKTEIENSLAKEILSGKAPEGSTIEVSYSPKSGIALQPVTPAKPKVAKDT
ncbi:MAG TPA: AAA family ATPase [Candidatus Saccharimonadales bacterium]|nr:AAA family ATPase [Candidatus Saccharimonadales bacterium]